MVLPLQISSFAYAVPACACMRRCDYALGALLAVLVVTSVGNHAQPYDLHTAEPRTALQALDVALAHLTVAAFALRFWTRPALWWALLYVAATYWIAIPEARRRFHRLHSPTADDARHARRELVAWHCSLHVVSAVAMAYLVGTARAAFKQPPRVWGK